MGKFELTTRKNGEFQFNLKASNGQVILTSQGYKTKASCLNGIESVRKNSQDLARFEKKLLPMANRSLTSWLPMVKLLVQARCTLLMLPARMVLILS